jgi:uncharacterized membrane protein YgdD (TMEM256/DUF423 family)
MAMDGRAALAAGTIAMFVAVAAGAFGAHALESTLTAARMGVWQTAVRYEAWHGLALIGVGVLMQGPAPRARALRLAAWLFAAGIVLFSGSLYALVLADARGLGAITPLGGAALLAGWATFAWAVLRRD